MSVSCTATERDDDIEGGCDESSEDEAWEAAFCGHGDGECVAGIYGWCC